MLAQKYVVFAIIASVLYTINVLQQVDSAPSNIRYSNDFNQYPVVYRRYVRRRPSIYLHDKFMENIVEIFETKEEPPSFGAIMTDEDLDKFIFCDFNRHMEMCKQYWEAIKPASTAATPKPFSVTSTTAKPTEIDGIPHLEEVEYVYSDENQEEGMKDIDYYTEEINY